MKFNSNKINALYGNEVSRNEEVRPNQIKSFNFCCFQAPRTESSVCGAFFVRVSLKYLKDCGKAETKALAVHCIVRANEERTDRRGCDYTVYDLQKLTGLHADTIKGAIKVLEGMGLCERTVYKRYKFRTAKSNHNKHNMTIKVDLTGDVFVSTYHDILKARVVNKLRQMRNYNDAADVLDDILSSTHKGTVKEIKRLRKMTMEHRKQRFNDGGLGNYGITYAKLAEYLDVAVPLCRQMVKELVEDGIIEKKTKRERIKMSHKSELEYKEYTYVFRGYLYKVYANEYRILSDPYSKTPAERKAA